MHTKVLKYNHSYNRSQLQYSIKTLTIKIMHKQWTIAIHKKVIKCSSANKSYQLQYCKQKLSLATCAHKSYRSFDAILRFLISDNFLKMRNYLCIQSASWSPNHIRKNRLWKKFVSAFSRLKWLIYTYIKQGFACVPLCEQNQAHCRC